MLRPYIIRTGVTVPSDGGAEEIVAESLLNVDEVWDVEVLFINVGPGAVKLTVDQVLIIGDSDNPEDDGSATIRLLTDVSIAEGAQYKWTPAVRGWLSPSMTVDAGFTHEITLETLTDAVSDAIVQVVVMGVWSSYGRTNIPVSLA